MKICDYGCEKEGKYLLSDETKVCSYCLEKPAKYQLNNGKYCCENSTSKCESIKIKNRELNSGEKKCCAKNCPIWRKLK